MAFEDEHGIRYQQRLGRRVMVVVGKLLQVVGEGLQAEVPGETFQANTTRFMEHFGFTSWPTGGDALIIETEQGAVGHGTSDATGKPTGGPGQSAQYDSSQNAIQCKGADGIELKNAVGNLDLDNGAGKVRLHSTGAKAAARKDDKVDRITEMATWMSQVEGYINGIAPGTVTPLTSETFGDIADGSANVEIG